MTSRLMAIMVLVAAAFLAVPSSAQTNCGVYASCGTCTPVGGCGWCTYSGTCEAGNQTGSFVGCTGQYWVWTAQYCPATPAPTPVSCSALTTCNSCTAQGSCGWCAFVGQCQRGNQSGSVEGCTGQYWDWTSAQCSTPTPATPAPISCSAYTCLSCTQMATCGWCASTATCQAGNSIGPFNATCLNWDWTSNLCSTPTPATPAPISCSAYTCLSCTQLASCGWCASTATCQSGTSTGPYNATCLNWDWTTNQCSTPAPPTPTAVSTCQNAYSCAQCTQLASCGWCASTLTCLNGTNVGPFNGTCLNWDWQNSQCGQQDAAKTAKLH